MASPNQQSVPRKALFMCNAEAGHANVFLAVASTLAAVEPGVEVHLASFKALEKRVAQISERTKRRVPNGSSITYHELTGCGLWEATTRRDPAFADDLYHGGTGFWHTLRIMRSLTVTMMNPWTGPEYVEVFTSAVDIIKLVRPTVVVLDNAFPPAMAACLHTGTKYLVLSPNTLKDVLAPVQPRGEILWKYPFVGSALPYPVPWHLVPVNVLLVLFVAVSLALDRRMKKTAAYVLAVSGVKATTVVDCFFDPPSRHVPVLVSTRPEIELPLNMDPRLQKMRVIGCGPILLESTPLAEHDSTLETWLARGPTVLICLGTLTQFTEESATEMALALRMLLTHAEKTIPPGKRLQVLWKLTAIRDGRGDISSESVAHSILGHEMQEDRVRIVEWFNVEPRSILRSGHIVLNVNHGGASSFLEALSEGVPQVVLPQWADCYDFAHRAEYLQIGRWGNKISKPRWNAAELGPVLIDVLSGPEAKVRRQKVNALATICSKDGGGSMVATRAILETL